MNKPEYKLHDTKWREDLELPADLVDVLCYLLAGRGLKV